MNFGSPESLIGRPTSDVLADVLDAFRAYEASGDFLHPLVRLHFAEVDGLARLVASRPAAGPNRMAAAQLLSAVASAAHDLGDLDNAVATTEDWLDSFAGRFEMLALARTVLATGGSADPRAMMLVPIGNCEITLLTYGTEIRALTPYAGETLCVGTYPLVDDDHGGPAPVAPVPELTA